jgi:hypothetical protein
MKLFIYVTKSNMGGGGGGGRVHVQNVTTTFNFLLISYYSFVH